MRYAILADIHANLHAFNAVLEDMADRGGVDEIWCLGDVVGYGPHPCQCIDLLREYRHVCVAGNHDLAAIGKLKTAYFNPDAALACRWTASQLKPEHTVFLDNLPPVMEKDDFTMVHGSPREPIWEYLISVSVARENFNYFKTQFCLVGHSHMPLVFKHDETEESSYRPFQPNVGLVLGKNRLIINPGGVGQPRDGDPRASYAIYDSEPGVVKLYRVPYDIRTTQLEMVAQGLPLRLVNRLEQGM